MAICLSATLRGAPIVRPAGEERSPLLPSPSLSLSSSPSVRVFFAFHHRGINPGLEESLLLERGSNLSLCLSLSCLSARSLPVLFAPRVRYDFFLSPRRDSLETMDERRSRPDEIAVITGCMYNPALLTVPRYHLSSH